MAKYLDLTGLTHLWAKIKSYVGGLVSHDNLLDNWYFVGGGSQLGEGTFPINQRGSTSYTGKVRVINRWRITNEHSTLTLNSDCITLTAASTGNAFFRQFLPESLYGTYTYSAYLRGSGTGYVGLNINDVNLTNIAAVTYVNPGNSWTLVSGTFTTTGSGIDLFTIRVNAGTSIDIKSVKFEPGVVSTLPNDARPDYGLELTRSILSTAESDDTYANKMIATTDDITSAVNALDGGTIGTPSAAKTVTALSQTNGNVSATFGNIAIAANQVTSGTLPVERGGTGAATFTSGRALIGAGTDAVTTRAITNNTATSSAVTGSTNLTTMNTLRYAINRTTSVAAADTNYTTAMARGISLQRTATYVTTNGVITLVYD